MSLTAGTAGEGGAEAEPAFICSLEANLVSMCMSRAGLAPPGGLEPSGESASPFRGGSETLHLFPR